MEDHRATSKADLLTGFNSTASGEPPFSSVATSAHSFLDDTSFAVAATSDGNRHVIFQDSSGAIRDAFYSHTTLSWTSTASWIVPGNARNHTPFSAIVQKFANTSDEVKVP